MMKILLHLGLLCAAFILFTFSTSFAQVRLDVEDDAKIRGKLNISSGTNNTIVGEGSGQNVTGIANSFFGRGAGNKNSTGQQNTFLGAFSGRDHVNGKNNTFIGYAAAQLNINSTNSTYIGVLSGQTTPTDSLDRAIAIGYNAKVNCSNCVAIGGTGSNAVNVGIGIAAPSERLEVLGNVKAQKFIGDGSMLSGIDTALWEVDPVEGSLYELNSNVGIGIAAPSERLEVLGNVKAQKFIGDGSMLLGIDTALWEVDPVEGSLYKLNSRVGIGTSTPTVPLEVNGNVKLTGRLDINSLSNNMFIGRLVGTLNTTGNENVFVGRRAGLSNNTGSNNAFFGNLAGSDNLSGSQNTFVGNLAGEFNDVGQKNTYLGYGSGVLNISPGGSVPIAPNLEKSIAIGYNAKVNCSNCAVIGGTGSDAVNVGIGTTSPSERLEVNGKIKVSDEIIGLDGMTITGTVRATRYTGDGSLLTGIDTSLWAQSGEDIYIKNEEGRVGIGTNTPEALLHISSPTTSDSTGIKITQSGNNSLIYHNNGDLILRKVSQVNQLVLDASGNVGIGTATPSEKLDIDGKARIRDLPLGSGTTVVADTSGNLLLSSSSPNVNEQRIKDQQTEIENLQQENQLLKVENAEIKARLDKIEALLSGKVELNSINATITDASLEQNAPNPFSEVTNINYFIPEGTKRASLQVMDQDGRIIKRIPIQDSGKGQITLQANLLSAGTYSYSLILDGRVMETKQMVLTK